jgi:hypothetical protein
MAVLIDTFINLIDSFLLGMDTLYMWFSLQHLVVDCGCLFIAMYCHFIDLMFILTPYLSLLINQIWYSRMGIPGTVYLWDLWTPQS